MSSPENETGDQRAVSDGHVVFDERAVSDGQDGAGFGAMLQYYRGRAGLTQTQLAGFSTISVRAIRDLELGRVQRPRRVTVRLLADALRLSDERRAMLEAAAGRSPADAVGTAGRSTPVRGLPAPPLATAGPFLGREHEVRTLIELLAAGRDRLAAVVGLGGVGKTRLALAVAHELNARLGMPVLWLAADRREPGRAPAAHPVQPAQPWLRELLAEPDGAVDDLAAFIGDRPFLLVLDGQRPEAGRPDADPRTAGARAHLLSAEAQLTLLARCQKLRIVSTARTTEASASSLLGQRTLRLSPLPVGEGADFGGRVDFTDGVDGDSPGAAARLVLWHMRQLRPNWNATARDSAAIRALCRSLDAIPLALESAAAWSLVLPPTRLAAIAGSDPFAVTAAPSDRTRMRSDPVRSALTEAVAALTPQARGVLSLVSRWEQPWSLDQVTARSGYGFEDVSYAAHALLVHDLIRPEGADLDDTSGSFTVLNLVRHLLRAPAQPSVSAYLRPVGRVASAPANALTKR